MTRTNSGIDYEAAALGGDVPLGFQGTSSNGTPPTATVLTDSGTPSPAWSVNQWFGHVVTTANRAGVIVSNTATSVTVLGWFAQTAPGAAAAASTPAGNIAYQISSGQAPAWFIGLTATTTAIAATDTFLAGELFAAGGGLNRSIAAFTHTAGVASFTLTVTFTSVAADGSPVTVHRIGVFNSMVFVAPVSQVTSGVMFFETNLTNDAVLVPTASDKVVITETANL